MILTPYPNFNSTTVLCTVLYYAWVTCVNKCTLPHYSRSSINSEKRRQSENGIRDRTLVDLYELTNRFHVAMPLFGNTSQMTSKCGKNKKVSQEAIAKCVTDVVTTF